MEGWICPRCKKVHAPDVKSCPCPPGASSVLAGVPVKMNEEAARLFKPKEEGMVLQTK